MARSMSVKLGIRKIFINNDFISFQTKLSTYSSVKIKVQSADKKPGSYVVDFVIEERFAFIYKERARKQGTFKILQHYDYY